MTRVILAASRARARTRDGRKRAKDRGVRFGRPRKLTPHQRQEAIRRLSAGETQTDIARKFQRASHDHRKAYDC